MRKLFQLQWPDEVAQTREEPGAEPDEAESFSPRALRERIDQLIEDQTAAGLRGYDLIEKVYEDAWRRLLVEYFDALEKALATAASLDRSRRLDQEGWHQKEWFS